MALTLVTVLLMQAAVAGDVPARFSVLVPVASQPCTRTRAPDEIVVCADPLPDQTLPLPAEAVSPLPVPANRDMTGMGALAAEATPCAARGGGCQTGVDILGMGTALIRGVQKLVSPGSCCERPGESTSAGMLVSDVAGGAARLFRGKPDRSARVAIPLDPPDTRGRVLP